MKIGRLFSDLLAALGRSASPETGFALALKRLIALTGARAGALRFEPGRGAVLDMIVGARKASPLAGWLTARLDEPTRGIRLSRLGEPPPGWSGRQLAVLLRTTLGDAARPGRQHDTRRLPARVRARAGAGLASSTAHPAARAGQPPPRARDPGAAQGRPGRQPESRGGRNRPPHPESG